MDEYDLKTNATSRIIFAGGAADSFGDYHDLYAGASTVGRIGDRFEAAVLGRRVSGQLLFDRQITGAVHQREVSRIRRDDLEHVNLQVLRSGRMLAGAPGFEHLLAAGDAVLFDTTLPQRTVVHDADYVTISLARELVTQVGLNIRSLHGRILPRDAFPGLAHAVLSLAREAADFTDADLGGSRLIAELLRPVGEQSIRADSDGDIAVAARRLRAQLFIDMHLGRHDLDAQSVAFGAGMSRSSLYRAFAPIGGIGQEILRRRVARMRSTILRTGGDVRITPLAKEIGFTSLSHGTRAFSASYGLSPRELRKKVRSFSWDAVSDPNENILQAWLLSLSRVPSAP